MTAGNAEDRLAAAARELLRQKQAIALGATRSFLEAHPDWVERYGQLAFDRGVEDAAYHIDFLAAALDCRSPEAFADYTRWAAAMLQARGIEPAALAESLQRIGDELPALIDDAETLAQIRVFVRGGCEACAEAAADGVDSAEEAPCEDRFAERRGALVSALLAGDQEESVALLRRAIRDSSPAVAYAEVAAAAMVEIGRRWQACEISVADEHRATAVAEFAIARLYPELPRAAPTEPRRAVVSGVEGELHQFGAHLLADVLESVGWNVCFLGTNLPAREIAAAIGSHRADLLALSTTLLSNLTKARQVIELVRSEHPSCRVLVGGRAYRPLRDGARLVGADACASTLAEAVELGAA